MHGTMLWFNQVKDLGVIAPEGGEGLRVYGSDFAEGERPTGRCAGAAVTFRVTEQDEERKATDVSFVPEVAPRRARMRHARYRSG
jgi:cold shock CspA family protein